MNFKSSVGPTLYLEIMEVSGLQCRQEVEDGVHPGGAGGAGVLAAQRAPAVQTELHRARQTLLPPSQTKAEKSVSIFWSFELS